VARAKPNLVAVGSRPPASAPDPAPQSTSRPNSRGTWLIIGLLVIAAVALAIQTRRVAELSGRAESLEVELSGARMSLRGYEQRFGQIQASVGDLRAQLTQLEDLVERPPADASNP
jgi:hypothetical protein